MRLNASLLLLLATSLKSKTTRPFNSPRRWIIPTLQTGEQVIFALRDVLTKKLHTSAHLNNTTGVIGVYLDKGKYGYAMRNGVWCRMHQIKLLVRYWYEPTMGA
jgi:hypothetical protein